MALRVAPSAGFLRSFLSVSQSRLCATAAPSTSIPSLLTPGRWQSSLLPAIVIPIPSLVTNIWEGILRAVPKKKTSHMKKRSRQMAGKALKDVTALNKCSSCGRTKRAHVLCPYCVASIRRWFGTDFAPEDAAAKAKKAEEKAKKEKEWEENRRF